MPSFVLHYAGRYAAAERFFDRFLEVGRREGSAFAIGIATNHLTHLHTVTGRVADAVELGELAMTNNSEHRIDLGMGQVIGYYGQALLEADRLAEAEQVLRTVEDWPISIHAVFGFQQRARLRILQGRWHDALADAAAIEQLHQPLGVVNPAFGSAACEAALAWSRLEDSDRAVELVRTELERARAWNAPGTLARVLRTAALVDPDVDTAQALLAESVSVVSGSGAALEHIESLVEHGAMLRRCGAASDARERLEAGLELAHRANATRLERRAHDELLATGARPRRLARTGLDALTPSERRVARLAAAGRTNREIAQELYVTAKTVEVHLSSTYRKLDISSRAQLPDVIAAEA